MTQEPKKIQRIATKTKVTIRMHPGGVSSHQNEDKAYLPPRHPQAFAQPVSTHAALPPVFPAASSGSPKIPVAKPPTGRIVQGATPKIGSESTLSAAPAPKSQNSRSGDGDKKESFSAEDKKIIKGTPATSEHIAMIEIEDIKEQMHNYLEVCDSVSAGNWQPKDIIDIIHVFVRSLSFDVVSMAVISASQRSQFDTLVSRGYKTPPGNNVLSVWQSAITEGSTIDWGHLMKIASDTTTDLAYWIVHEGLNSVGYVPIHDNKIIYGFLFLGGMKKRNSAIGSSLLQLCGSRLGLSLALQRTNPAGGGSQTAHVDTVHEIQKQVIFLKDYIKSFKESNNNAGSNELNVFLEKCDKAVSESSQLLGRIVANAAGNGKTV